MTRSEFDKFCRKLKAATHVVQWGGASVWKIGGKIFAIYSDWGEGAHGKVSFKCSDLVYDILKEQEGLISAPYLARAKWIQAAAPGALTDEEIEDYIRAAHEIVGRKLPKAVKRDLGLEF